MDFHVSPKKLFNTERYRTDNAKVDLNTERKEQLKIALTAKMEELL